MVFMRRGLLIIFSGPSGVGKGTVRKLFFDREELNLAFSISMTTRKPRNGEVDGQDYYFVTQERFNEALQNNELLEHAEFVGNHYGTLLAEVDRLRDLGKNVLLEIEVQGALQVIDRVPDSLSIFLVPPSMEELKRRIEGRQTESQDVINERLEKAAKEMELMNHYRYVICNEDPQKAADSVALIIKRNIETTL
uniref:Guanylate kinase n=2 Tax=Erysipelothrix rhusiopathiae TaxID=1648 RepID=E7FUY5_ERYRH|nr:guanylate kinase [Erysipelothrix rhusiopathiae ATCC 19414]